MLAKRVGRKQPIVAHMPPSGMPRVLWMIENGNPNGFPIHRTVIIAPIGPFTPGLVIANTFAVDDMAVADGALEPHGLGKSHRHRTLLGIAEGERAVACVQSDLKIEDPFAGAGGFI